MMVGIEEIKIFEESNVLINNEKIYKKMSNAINPYGDGNASKKIVEAIKEYYNI
jgi:UDP-N-acetylglucosamine 2-epimerase (non-hydrolysing)